MSEHGYHPPTKAYVMIFVALAILTTATVLISLSPLGHGTREVFAIGIAVVKALLVAAIFMNLKFEPRTIVVFAVAPIILAVWFIIAIKPDVG
jgi:caa(3)-type oxidase subunit IV